MNFPVNNFMVFYIIKSFQISQRKLFSSPPLSLKLHLIILAQRPSTWSQAVYASRRNSCVENLSRNYAEGAFVSNRNFGFLRGRSSITVNPCVKVIETVRRHFSTPSTHNDKLAYDFHVIETEVNHFQSKWIIRREGKCKVQLKCTGTGSRAKNLVDVDYIIDVAKDCLMDDFTEIVTWGKWKYSTRLIELASCVIVVSRLTPSSELIAP